MGEEVLGGGSQPAHGAARLLGGPGSGGGFQVPAPPPRAADGVAQQYEPLEGRRGRSGSAAAAASPRHRAGGPDADAESLRDIPGMHV